ncbi:hypothetical protein GLA29479_3016 [Lysobacter antibioticus]|nr:hypothetical protein GLA29479_3016 [Lysobacter antibioticus]
MNRAVRTGPERCGPGRRCDCGRVGWLKAGLPRAGVKAATTIGSCIANSRERPVVELTTATRPNAYARTWAYARAAGSA